MPSGLMPTYKYRPGVVGDPFLKTRSTRRARLFFGGTYFRARDPGGNGNNISLEVIEFTTGGIKQGKMIVTNHNIDYKENVVGPANVESLVQKLHWSERYTIEDLTTTPKARRYSISLQIAPGVTLAEELGFYSWGSLFHVPSKVSVKLTPKTAEFTAGSVVTIKPRVRVYDLVLKPAEAPVPPGLGSPEGWDIALLRAAVNEADPWIEMMPRSGTPAPSADPTAPPPIPLAVKFDEQDNGIDTAVLSIFPETYLSGGDGLPESPTGERTGPSRSIVFINYGEKYNGYLSEVNQIFEWVGDDSVAGAWKPY